jgi:hypothetical protein
MIKVIKCYKWTLYINIGLMRYIIIASHNAKGFSSAFF